MMCNRRFASSALPHMAASPIGRIAAGGASGAASGQAGRIVTGLGMLVSAGNTLANVGSINDHLQAYKSGDPASGLRTLFGVGAACMGIAGSWATSTLWGFVFAAGTLDCLILRHGLEGEALKTPDKLQSGAIDLAGALWGLGMLRASGGAAVAGNALGMAAAIYNSDTAKEQVVKGVQCTAEEAGARLGSLAQIAFAGSIEPLELEMLMLDMG